MGVKTDHDLLIVINTKLDAIVATSLALETRQQADTKRLEDRISVLERAAERAQGALMAGRAIWLVLGAVPPSLIILIVGLVYGTH